MKKLLLIISICLFAASLAWANPAAMMTANVAASSCSTIDSQETGTSDALVGYDAATDYLYVETSFTATGGTGKTFYLYMKKAGTPTSDMVLAVCTDSGGAPDSCTNADATYNVAGLTTGYTWNAKFNIAAGYVFTASQKYHLRIYWNAAASGANIAYWRYNNNVAGQAVNYSADASSWTGIDTSGQALFIIKDCVE